jgi:hypothetical protein
MGGHVGAYRLVNGSVDDLKKGIEQAGEKRARRSRKEQKRRDRKLRQGTRVCTWCKKERPYSLFFHSLGQGRGYTTKVCWDCYRNVERKRRAKRKGRV